MAEAIHVFSIPLGSAKQGLTNRQISLRKNKARAIVHATMPSSKYLTNSLLRERIISEGGLLWLAFDLVETRQIHLLSSDPRRGREWLASTLNSLHRDLERLKDEAENTVIHVGELTELVSRLSTMAGNELADTIEDLSEQNWALWKLIHARKGHLISIEFSTGGVGITMPLFPAHIAEKHHRHVRVRVKSVTKKYAVMEFLGETEISSHTNISECPKTIKLIRPMGTSPIERNAWFLLYVAEFHNLVIEATVRMVLKLSDFSSDHFELVKLENASELTREAKAVVQLLMSEDS